MNKRASIKSILLIIVALFCVVTPNNAQSKKEKKKKKNKNTVVELRVDTVVLVDTMTIYVEKKFSADTLFNFKNRAAVSSAKLDSLTNLLLAEYKLDELNSFTEVSNSGEAEYSDTKINKLPDSYFIERFDDLHTEIELPYNSIIKKFISQYINGWKYMDIMLGRAMIYMPMIEEVLLKNDMPLELKILPIVESSLRPSAISYMGAAGLWQFMPSTARLYKLKISTLVDERMDIIKSTEAACRYLKDLNKIYDNWTLSLAAYNCGPGNVNRALAKVKNPDSYWDIYPYLPFQTRDYIPKYIAANYAFTFYKDHGVELNTIPEHIIIDTVKVENTLMDLRQISSTIGVSEESLKQLNPQFRQGVVPATTASQVIYLPSDKILSFNVEKDNIFAKESKYIKSRKSILDMDLTPKVYIVKSGDVLGKIARIHRVSISRLMQLNNLKNANSLRIGQKLKVS